jgi:hypothetical protein
MDGKQRDTSMRLVLASVPVQALMMIGAAALVMGTASTSPAPLQQMPFKCAMMLDPGAPAVTACPCPAGWTEGYWGGPAESYGYWGGSKDGAGQPAAFSAPADGPAAAGNPAGTVQACAVTVQVDPATGQQVASQAQCCG